MPSSLTALAAAHSAAHRPRVPLPGASHRTFVDVPHDALTLAR
jgi:hypothetical protein